MPARAASSTPWPAAPEAGSPAIVSDQPGTTRDYLTADLDLDGVKCQLIDTAGIEEALPESDAATVEGAARKCRSEQVRTAHVRVLCLEAGSSGAGSRSRKYGVRESGAEPADRGADQVQTGRSPMIAATRARVPAPAPRADLGNQRRYRSWDSQAQRGDSRGGVCKRPVRGPTWWWARPCVAASRCDWPPRRSTAPARPCGRASARN